MMLILLRLLHLHITLARNTLKFGYLGLIKGLRKKTFRA